jgi:hypothetical protein
MKIPVFHDEHGTAIVAAAAMLNALEVVGKRIEDVKLACSGVGAAAVACFNLAVGLACGARTSGSPTARAWSTRAAASRWTRRRRSTRRRRMPAPWPTSCKGRTCSSASRPRACSSPRWFGPCRAADHPGHGQPRPGDPPRSRQGGTPRLHHRDRPERLPEPGQQRPCASRSSPAARSTSAPPRSTRR